MTAALLRNDQQGREAFSELAFSVVNWLLRYYEDIESFPVRSQVHPGDLLKRFPQTPPENPISIPDVLNKLNDDVLPGITHWQHPRFFAYFPGNASFPSIAGEMLASGIAAQCMKWETSPVATEMEQRCLEWCSHLLGLPSEWKGVIQDTASTATLTALLTAREWKSNFRISQHGFDGKRYRIYTSQEAHSSVEKAVRLAGFGTENLVKIETDGHLALIPSVLERHIQSDLSAGYIPTAVVSTIGTTSTGAVDPVEAISHLSTRYDLWHHLDAAYAGSALMLEEYAHLRSGFNGVDSFVFNPHKWMFMQFDCSCYYVRNPEMLTRTMTITPSYLVSGNQERHIDYKDWGIPLGRRFRSLKMWMTFCLLGTASIKERIRQHINLSRVVEKWIVEHDKLTLAFPRSFNLVAFHLRSEIDPEGLLTKQLCDNINSAGKMYLTHTIVNDQGLIRMVTGQTYTDESHVQESLLYIDKEITHLL